MAEQMMRRVFVGIGVILLLGACNADAQWVGSVAGGVNLGGAADQLYPRASLSFGRWTDRFALELDAG